VDVFDSYISSDGVRSLAGVSGDGHDVVEPKALKRAHRISFPWAERVAEPDQPANGSGPDHDDRLPLRRSAS
jgi:hypothetical protein